MGYRNLTEFAEIVEKVPIFAYRSEDKIRRFLAIAKHREDQERQVIGFSSSMDSWKDLSIGQNAIFSGIGFWCNHIVAKSTNKKLTSIYLYSSDTSKRKTSLCQTISDFGRVYVHCRTANSWQEKYAIDANGDNSYNALIVGR